MSEMELITGLDREIEKLRRQRDMVDCWWRFQLGELVNRVDAEYRQEEQKKQKNPRVSTGVASRVSRALAMNKSSTSLFRKFVRLFTWFEIKELVENQYNWNHFKAVLNSRDLDACKEYMRANVALPRYTDFIVRMREMRLL